MNQYHVLRKGTDITATQSDRIKQSYIKGGYSLMRTVMAASEEDAINNTNTQTASTQRTETKQTAMAHGYSVPVMETSDGIATILTVIAVLGIIGGVWLLVQASPMGITALASSVVTLALARILNRLLDISNSLKIANQNNKGA